MLGMSSMGFGVGSGLGLGSAYDHISVKTSMEDSHC